MKNNGEKILMSTALIVWGGIGCMIAGAHFMSATPATPIDNVEATMTHSVECGGECVEERFRCGGEQTECKDHSCVDEKCCDGLCSPEARCIECVLEDAST